MRQLVIILCVGWSACLVSAETFSLLDECHKTIVYKPYNWNHELVGLIDKEYEDATRDILNLSDRVKNVTNAACSTDNCSEICHAAAINVQDEMEERIGVKRQLGYLRDLLREIQFEQNMIRRKLITYAGSENEFGVYPVDLVRKLNDENEYFLTVGSLKDLSDEELDSKRFEMSSEIECVRNKLLEKIRADDSISGAISLGDKKAIFEMEKIALEKKEVLEKYIKEVSPENSSLEGDSVFLKLEKEYLAVEYELRLARGHICINNQDDYERLLVYWQNLREKYARIIAEIGLRSVKRKRSVQLMK